jgi:hypothetical protein
MVRGEVAKLLVNAPGVVHVKVSGASHGAGNWATIVDFGHHLKSLIQFAKVLDVVTGVVLDGETIVGPAAAATRERGALCN